MSEITYQAEDEFKAPSFSLRQTIRIFSSAIGITITLLYYTMLSMKNQVLFRGQSSFSVSSLRKHIIMQYVPRDTLIKAKRNKISRVSSRV